ncbi:uncharacterized protein LOC114315992 isoform X1 [Camellia sinensis]|uniref:uncharacterized protein LOC114315992 isoform X1 n=1 Tax=Camellia sinensis TaxID=4442 RepID=UPI001035DEE5|nr:uncharacterized protein LOC114315992 isoform X1 [Camellia sinensis]
MRNIFIYIAIAHCDSPGLPKAFGTAGTPSPTFCNGVDRRFEVHVISEVPDTPSQLKIHCKSSDKDLGVQLNNGQDFRWSLRENFFGTILYFCRFWWNTLERHCQRQEELWLCVWSVRPDGFYLGNGIWHILWTLMKRRELRYNSFRKNLRGNHYQQHMQTIFNFFSSPVRRIIFGPSKICEELDIN